LPFTRLANRIALGFAALVAIAQAAFVLAAPLEAWNAPFPISDQIGWLDFRVFPLSLVMFLSIGIVALVASLVARYTIDSLERRFRFANLLLLSMAGMNGLVLASDLFVLYIFLEITAVASFILIALEKGRDAFEGAFKYMVLSAVATTLLLAGLALLFMAAGGTSFSEVAAAITRSRGSPLPLTAIALFLCGLFIKAGLVPFHGWLPDAYSAAPAPVSVLLAGIVTKTTGVYTLIRLVTSVFGDSQAMKSVLLLVGGVSIVVGALLALGQKDFKRMLAYSSISQVGYIVLGLGAGTRLALAGAIFHLFNHAIFKSLLFVNSAAVERQSGTTDMGKLGGISSRMPITSTTSVIAILSTAGIPPLSGFWSKLIIVVAVWRAGFHGYATLAIMASLLTLAYFLVMQRRVFFGKVSESCSGLQEASFWGVAPAVLLALITIGLGVSIPWLFETFLLPVRSFL
jgi:multicomponent Na+:H+ antiporter subunit D